MTRPGHIFISHGSENRDRANELAQFLEARGARAWIAPRDVRPGMDYSEQLQLAIEECAAFLVLVTDDSNKSPYVRVETEMAFSINKPIFPVRVSDVKPAAGLALFLKIKHWTDAYGPEREANLERLMRELQVLGAASSPAAPEPAPPPPPPAGSVTFSDYDEPSAAPPPPPPPPATAHPAPPPTPAPSAGEPVLTFGIGTPMPPHQPAPVTGGPIGGGGWPPPGGAHPAASAGGWAPASAPQRQPADFADEAVQRALIGPNADHYINSWRRMDAGRSILSFNIAGLLGNYFWLAYRKMWIPLAAGIAVLGLAEVVAGIGLPFVILGWLLIIGFCVALGLFGDHLYRLHLRRAAAGGGSIDQLRARGGASMTGPAVLAGIALLGAIIGWVAMNRESGSESKASETQAERTKDGGGSADGENEEGASEGGDAER